MKTLKGGVVDKLGKNHSPNVDEITDKPYQKQEPTREQKCRELTELNGGVWHEFASAHDMGNRCSCRCICGNLDEHIKANNPTYPDAKSILEVMMKRKDWYYFDDKKNNWSGFVYKIGWVGYERWGADDEQPVFLIENKYIMEKDLLLTEAWEWSNEVRRIRNEMLP